MDGQVRVLLSESGGDAERVDALTGYLRQELLELDVDNVARLSAGAAPPGARALDAIAVGGLLVSLADSSGLRAVVGRIRSWLSRDGGAARTVRLEMGGDSLELTGASTADQERLVQLFLDKHAPA